MTFTLSYKNYYNIHVQTMANEDKRDDVSVSYHKVLEEREQDTIKDILKDGA